MALNSCFGAWDTQIRGVGQKLRDLAEPGWYADMSVNEICFLLMVVVVVVFVFFLGSGVG